MSARRRVESDRRNALRAFRDTTGKDDPERAVYWLEELAKAEFRGRGDTMGAARDRVAEKSGAPISKTKRLWDRWQTMKEVAGSVMIPLMLAYEELVSANEAAAEAYRTERLDLKEQRHAADLERARQGVGMVADRN